LNKPARDPAEVAAALHDRAVALFDRGERERARAASTCRRALTLMERAVGPDHPDVAAILNSLGRSPSTGRVCRGRSPLRPLGPDHGRDGEVGRGDDPDLDLDLDLVRVRVASLGNLGMVLRHQGRYGEAEPFLKRALGLAEATFGPRDLEVGSLLNQLGVLYKYQGRFAEAGRSTAARCGSPSGPSGRHPECDDLPQPRRPRARPRPLRPRRAVRPPLGAIRERALGPITPDVAADVAALARSWPNGRHDEAEALYLRALAVFERVYGPVHYEVAINLNNLGALHQARASRRRPRVSTAAPWRSRRRSSVPTTRRRHDPAQPRRAPAPLGRHDEADPSTAGLSLFVAALGRASRVVTCRRTTPACSARWPASRGAGARPKPAPGRPGPVGWASLS